MAAALIALAVSLLMLRSRCDLQQPATDFVAPGQLRVRTTRRQGVAAGAPASGMRAGRRPAPGGARASSRVSLRGGFGPLPSTTLRRRESLALRSEAELERAMEQAEDEGKVLVVTYYASWCRACHALLSHIQRLSAQEKYHDVTFASMDFEYGRDLLKAKGAKKFPFLEIYRDGEIRRQWTGSNKDRLLERLDDEMAMVPSGVEAELALA